MPEKELVLVFSMSHWIDRGPPLDRQSDIFGQFNILIIHIWAWPTGNKPKWKLQNWYMHPCSCLLQSDDCIESAFYHCPNSKDQKIYNKFKELSPLCPLNLYKTKPSTSIKFLFWLEQPTSMWDHVISNTSNHTKAEWPTVDREAGWGHAVDYAGQCQYATWWSKYEYSLPIRLDMSPQRDCIIMLPLCWPITCPLVSKY